MQYSSNGLTPLTGRHREATDLPHEVAGRSHKATDRPHNLKVDLMKVWTNPIVVAECTGNKRFTFDAENALYLPCYVVCGGK